MSSSLTSGCRLRCIGRRVPGLAPVLATALAMVLFVSTAWAQTASQGRFLGRAEIDVYGIGLRVEPATQTVPKNFATIVSTYLGAATQPTLLPPFAPDAQVRGTLRGPGLATPLDLVAAPNTPFNIPPLTVAGTYTFDNIRLVSGGELLLRGAPESVRIEVIDRLLVTSVTAHALTADEIRERGIVYDSSSFQAYSFTAAFALEDGSQLAVDLPVLLPTLATVAPASPSEIELQGIQTPQLRSLNTLVPDTLRIQARVPNLSVVGFALQLDQSAGSQNFVVPAIPGVIVIPGDIGFLNQFFAVKLMVGNVAPTGSGLDVLDLQATISLPAGPDNVVGSSDDPLRMARTASGSQGTVPVSQPGPDGLTNTADDIRILSPGTTGSAEFLVEGLREGSHSLEIALAGTLRGLPSGPVPITGRAAGSVLVRNPSFTLTFTHPDVVNAGEPYTLDVTVTNTSTSPANAVSLNLFGQNISGARLDDQASKSIEQLRPDDSATVSFRLIANRTGKVTAATLDSGENVAGRFMFKTAIGELSVPLSPDSLVLPKEAASLPASLRDAALGVLGRAWAVATAPPAALPPGLTRFSRQIVLDRSVQVAGAGLRVTFGEPVARAAADLWMDMLGSEYRLLPERVPAGDTSDLLSLLQRDVTGFDLVRRQSVRGDALAAAVASLVAPDALSDSVTFHRSLAEQLTSRPGHVSVLLARTSGAGALPIAGVLTDAAGHRLGGLAGGKVVKDVPFGDQLLLLDASGNVAGELFSIAVPATGTYSLALAPRAGAAGTFNVSVAYPAADGHLRFASALNLAVGSIPTIAFGASDQTRIVFTATAAGPPVPLSPQPVVDPAPRVLGVRQLAEADVIGCAEPELASRNLHAGRVLAVLFSEQVTSASVQDKAAASEIRAFAIDGGQVVSVALQPGRRIAYIALRQPVGPLVPRQLTITDVRDSTGNTTGTTTVPIETTVQDEAGVVFGRVSQADGAAVAFATVRLFYEFRCVEPKVVGVAELTADANGLYSFDYVLKGADTIRLVAIDPESRDVRTVRFNLARAGQRLGVDIVFVGRGSIAGRTLAEDGRTPLPGTVIRLTSLTDQTQYGATSDAGGAYVLNRIPVGSVLIEAVNTSRPAQAFFSEVVPFAGAAVTRDLVLLDVRPSDPVQRGRLQGRVLRADGFTAVAAVPVVAYYRTRSQAGVVCPPAGDNPEPGECAIAVATAGSDGSFDFGGITAGDLRLDAFDQGGYQQGGVRIQVPVDGTAVVNVLLGGGFGTVNGVVLDATGAPVPDAQVGGGLSVVNVRPNGTFTLTDVPVGRRELVAVSEALRATGRTTIDVVQANEPVNATIVLSRSGSVAGVVRNVAGAAQAGIRVYVFNDCFDDNQVPSICIAGQTTTSAAGAYRIDRLPVGGYTVSAFRRDLKDGNLALFSIGFNNQVVVQDITFRGGAGHVIGRVLRAETCATPPCADTPLPARVSISGDRLVAAGGQIGVRFERTQNWKIVDNDPTTGAFSFDDVFVGPFTVRAAGLFSPEPVTAEGTVPSAGATATVDLRLQPTSRLTGTVLAPDGVTPVTNRQIALRFHSNAVVVVCTEDAATGDSDCQSLPQGIQEAFAATDAQGRFSFPLVNAGPFTLSATDPEGRVAETRGNVRPGETLDIPVRLLGRAGLTVRVFRSDGSTPVNGASVQVTSLEFPRTVRTGIATNGSITFAGGDALSEGAFVVVASGTNGFAGRVAGRIATEGEAATVDVFVADATGTVEGQVVRSDTAGALVPVPNAEVIVSNGTGPIAFAVSDASGRFSIPFVVPGPITVESFDPVTAARGRATADVIVGTVATQVTVRLDALGVIRGTVVDSRTLQPLRGWTVVLQQATLSGRSVPEQTTQTSVDGSFSFPGAVVGNFHIEAFTAGIADRGQVNGQVSRGGQLVDVPVAVAITRRLTGRVTGVVTSPTGTPVPNAVVEVCPVGEACLGTTGGGDGRFVVANVPLGRFTATAQAQVTGAPSVGTSGGTLLIADQTVDLTLALQSLSSVEGTVFEVVNGNRVPSANAAVRLSGSPGSGCAADCVQSADGQGRFRFTNVPAVRFTVTASSLAGLSGAIGGVLNPGESRSGLEVTLAPAVSLSGRVVLPDGTAASGVIIELDRGGRLYAQTGNDGRFAFATIGGGAYTLNVTDPIGGGIARRAGTAIALTPIDLGDIVLDVAPPVVAASTPAAGAVGVARVGDLRVQFSERVLATTVTASNITLTGPEGAIAGQLELTNSDQDVLFHLLPGASLRDSARYTLRVTNVQDLVGRRMSSDYVATFTTEDITPPAVADVSPLNNSTGTALDAVVRVRFSEIVDPSRFVGAPITVTGPQGAVAGRVDFIVSNSVAVFTPTFPFADATPYTVTVAAPTDLSGRTGTAFTSQFVTSDRTPPVVVSLTASRATVAANAIVDVTATVAPSDVALVDFYVNDTLVLTDRVPPFALALQATAAFGGPGAHLTIRAFATDTSGNRSVQAAQTGVDIIADTPPTTRITAPAADTVVTPRQRVTVEVTAADDVGLANIGFVARLVPTGAPSTGLAASTRLMTAPVTGRVESFDFLVPDTAPGGAVITLDASSQDGGGQITAAARVSLRVADTVGPNVTISGVTSGQRVRPGQTVTAVVAADDPGSVVEVGLQVSGALAQQQSRQVTPALPSVTTSFAFTVPATATVNERVTLQAYAIDAAGNRANSAQTTLAMADQNPPTVTLRTDTGGLTVVPGRTVSVIVEALDDVGLGTLRLSASGPAGYSFDESRSVPPVSPAAATFALAIPSTIADGSAIVLTARAVDASGNSSTPVQLTLTARAVANVTLPPSLLLRAGVTQPITVGLDTPAGAAGLQVDLVSRNPAVATVSSFVTFAAGEVQQTASVHAVATGTTQIDAVIGGAVRQSMTVTVAGGVVRGVVLAASGEPPQLLPVAGAAVSVLHAGAPIPTLTDANGSFEVDGVVGGGLDGRAIAIRASNGALLGYLDTALDVPNGSADVSVVLIAAGALHGTVVQPDGTTSVGAGIRVDLFEAGAPTVAIATTFTDAQGSWQFPLLAPGDYRLDAADQSGNRARSAITVTAGTDLNVAMAFLGRGNVSGVVRTGAGVPVPNAAVDLSSSSIFGVGPLQSVTTDGTGRYQFSGIFIGTVTVQARDLVTNQAGTAVGQLVSAGQQLDLPVQLASFANLRGTVRRSDGTTAAAGAVVTIRINGATFRVSADANGDYAADFLPLGAYVVSVSDAATRGLGTTQGTFTTSGETQVRDVTLLPQGALLVTVNDANGAPVNGAAVTATTNGFSLTDSLSGTTSTLNGVDGQVLLDRLLIGSFIVQASANGLNGSASGQLLANVVQPVTIALEAQGTIRGTVLDQDGQAFATGSVQAELSNGQLVSTPIADGQYSFSLRLGSYTIRAFDGTGRLRAVSAAAVLTTNGQVLVRNLQFIGYGQVSGRVLHPVPGGDAGNLTVVLQSLDATFGGFFSTNSDAAGNYQFTGIPTGQLRVSVSKPSESLRGEAAGTLTSFNVPLSLDILLQNNAVSLPVGLGDVNGSSYIINGGGLLTSQIGSQLFAGVGGLTVRVNGTESTFAGTAFGTTEGDARQVVLRENGLQGLNVTRKIFIPASGYFARYVDVLTNPTAAAITADVKVTDRVSGFRNFFNFIQSFFVTRTSSGDGILDPAADNWAVLDAGGSDPYYALGAMRLALVNGGAGAADRVDALTFTSDANTGLSTYVQEWRAITVPAGSTVAVMHFLSQQATTAGAIASAERLVTLPPEALQALTPADIAAIRNFTVPATGVSTVAALPAIDGQVSGRVLEGDATTPVAGAQVVLTSSNPLYSRQWLAGTAADGAYQFAGAVGHPIPLADLTLVARHPANPTSLLSPTLTASFATGSSVLQRDIVFSQSGILRGVVRRTTGIPVSSGSLSVGSLLFTQIGADGRYELRGVPATTLILSGRTPNLAGGTDLNIPSVTVTLAPGEVRNLDLFVEPVGRLTGLLTDAAGVPQPGRTLFLSYVARGFNLALTTDTAGRFSAIDLPVGAVTLSATDPLTSYVTQQPAVIASDQTTDVTVRYIGNGSITVTVLRASGGPASGISVQATGSTFQRPAVTTGADGVAVIANVPLDQLATITAAHPGNTAIRTQATITLSASTQTNAAVSLTMPGYTTVTGLVRTPAGAAAGSNISVQSQGANAFLSTTSDGTSRYTIGPLPTASSVTLQTYHPTVLISFTRPFSRTAPLTLVDGQTSSLDLFVPAIAQLRVQVREADDTPIVGAAVQVRDQIFTFFNNRGVTDATGTLTVPQVPEGAVDIRVFRAGQTTTPAELVSTDVRRVDDATVVTATVVPRQFTVTIRGRVTEADGTTPLASPFPVQLIRAIDGTVLASSCASAGFCFSDGLTHTDGEILFNNVPLTAAGAIVRTFAPISGSSFGIYEARVTPTANGEVPVTIVQPFYRATFRGRVLASDGVTPVTAGVVFLKLRNGYTSFGLSPDATGTYTFPPQYLPTEGVIARYDLAGLAGGAFDTPSAPITARNQDVTVDIRLPVTTRFARFRGRVVAGDGVTPVSGQVRLTNVAACNGSCTAGFDGNGRFDLAVALGATGAYTLEMASYDNASAAVTRSGVASEGEIVDVGTVVLPISVVSGTVTFGSSTAANNVSVFATPVSGTGSTVFANNGPTAGSYVIVGLPAGTYTLTAQHNDSGLSATAPVTLATNAATASVNIQLPAVGDVVVRMFDQAGDPANSGRVVLRTPLVDRFCGPTDDVVPDAGVCTFSYVQPGSYYAQAALPVCDVDGTCQEPLLASASGTLADAGQTLTLDVHFDELNTVRVDASELEGVTINAGESLRLTLRAFSAAGPQGRYERTATLTVGEVDNSHVFPDVPPGHAVAFAERLNPDNQTWEGIARAEFDVTTGPDNEVLVPLHVDSGRSVPYLERDGADYFHVLDDGGADRDGFLYDFSTNTVLFSGAYSAIGMLTLDGSLTGGARAVAADGEVVFGPYGGGGSVFVTRRVFGSGQPFIRYLDVFENPTDVPVTAQISLANVVASVSPLLQSSPGDAAAGQLIYDNSGTGQPSLGIVFGGAGAPVRPVLGFVDGSPNASIMSASITIPPRSRRSLLRFVVLRDPDEVSFVLDGTAGLVDLSDTQALANLSAADRAEIVNFVVPAARPLPRTR